MSARTVVEIRPTELLRLSAEVVAKHTDPKMFKDFKEETFEPAFLELVALHRRAVRSRNEHVLPVLTVRSLLIDMIPGAEDGQHVCRDKCSDVPIGGAPNPTRTDLDRWYASILPIVSRAQKECPDRPLKRAAPATVQNGSVKAAAGSGTNFREFIVAMGNFQDGSRSTPCDFCNSPKHAFGPSCDKAKVMWPQVYANTVSKYPKFAEVMPQADHPPPPSRDPRSASGSPKGKA